MFGLCCLLITVLTYLPWYSLGLGDTVGDRLPPDLTPNYSLWSSGWGGWRIALPAVTILGVLLALVGVALWSRGRWPQGYGVILRAVAVAVVVLVVLTMAMRRPELRGTQDMLQRAEYLAHGDLHFDPGWASWLGAVMSLVGATSAFFTSAAAQ